MIRSSKEETFKNIIVEPGSVSVPPPENVKLGKLLAGALQKRPRLTILAQDRYNPESTFMISFPNLRFSTALRMHDSLPGSAVRYL